MGDMPSQAVTPSGVVEVHDPGGDPQPRLGPGAEAVPVDVLHFDGRVESLGGGVVQSRTDSAHRLQDPEPPAGLLVRLGGVLPYSTGGCNTVGLKGEQQFVEFFGWCLPAECLARSEWKMTPSMVPPRFAAAIRSEATARSASWCSLIA